MAISTPRPLTGPVYLSLDLDALDPAFVPGISHPEPGGMSTREAIGLIQAIPNDTSRSASPSSRTRAKGQA